MRQQYDKNKDTGLESLSSTTGFLRAVLYILRVKPGGLICGGYPASSDKVGLVRLSVLYILAMVRSASFGHSYQQPVAGSSSVLPPPIYQYVLQKHFNMFWCSGRTVAHERLLSTSPYIRRCLSQVGRSLYWLGQRVS